MRRHFFCLHEPLKYKNLTQSAVAVVAKSVKFSQMHRLWSVDGVSNGLRVNSLGNEYW